MKFADKLKAILETEITKADVAAQIAKVVMWNDATKAYYAGLDSEARVAFLDKSEEDQAKDVAKAAPPAGEYGSHDQAGYADPGLQSDKKPRYPLKVDGKWNEARIRSAWSYINVDANQTPYTHAQVGQIKDNIITAWKAAIDPAGPPAAAMKKKTIEKDVTMTIKPIAKIAESTGALDVFKANDEKMQAYGWASVATVGGVDVVDLQDDTITIEAAQQWLHKMFDSQRAGKMDHAGDDIAVVREGLTFSSDLQKALGIDLGMEGVLTLTHYTCPETWDKVKSGEWMHSIAGKMLVEVEEDEV